MPTSNRPPKGEVIGRQSLAITDLLKLTVSDVDDILSSSGIDEYLKMRGDGQVALCTRLLKYACASRDITIESPIKDNEDPRYELAEQQRDFCLSALSRMRGQTLRDVVINAMDSVAMGYSVQEIIWEQVKQEDGIVLNGSPATGMWVPRQFKHKRPDIIKFQVDNYYNIKGISHRDNDTVLYPVEKFYHCVIQPEYERPEGVSTYRGAWKWWKIKVQASQDFAVYMTKFACPTPRGRFPRSWTTEQRDSLLTTLDKFRTQTAIVIPADAEVDLLEANRGGDSTFVNSFEHIDRCISKAILGSFMAVDGNAKERGSQNLGQLHFDVFLLSVMNARQRIEDSFSTQVLERMCVYNFGPEAMTPKLSLGPLEDKQIDMLSQVFERLIGAGVAFPDEEFIRESLGMPPMPEEMRQVVSDKRDMGLEAQKKALESERVGQTSSPGGTNSTTKGSKTPQKGTK